MSDGNTTTVRAISDEVRNAIVAAAVTADEKRARSAEKSIAAQDGSYDALMRAQAEALHHITQQVIPSGPKPRDGLEAALSKVEARLAVTEQSVAALELQLGDKLKGLDVETSALTERLHGLRQRLEKFEEKQMHALAQIRLDVFNLANPSPKAVPPEPVGEPPDAWEPEAEPEAAPPPQEIAERAPTYLDTARKAAIEAAVRAAARPVRHRTPAERFWNKHRWVVLTAAAVLVVWFDAYVFANYQPAQGAYASVTGTAQDRARAELIRGLKYLNGTGMPADTAKARLWIAAAARQGDAVAENMMGTFYQTGTGVTADMPTAIGWYEKAARHGNLKATAALGKLYAGGWQDGTDYAKAAEWFAKAAAMGDVDAAFDLAILYERGLGVSRNTREAYKWYAIAAARGDRHAATRASVLGQGLAQRAALDRDVAAFTPVRLDKAANAVPQISG